MTKYSDADITRLVNLIRRQPMRCDFLTGAGMSKTAEIPLARELVSEIQQKYYDEVTRLSVDIRNDYGACMGALSIQERKDLLAPYLANAKINWAHIALACMMKAQHVRRVLTFNFDNVLARACGLLGLFPATYDFGISPADNVEFLSDPSIVHLHGQGYGPVMMNSHEETAGHARKLRSLIDESMTHSNLVVLGYSGEADQVFPIINECYRKVRRIIWLGFSNEPGAHLNPLLSGEHGNLCTYLGGVDADIFMVRIAQELGCFPPEVFTHPAQHLLDSMRDVIEFPLSKTNLKIDILRDTRDRLTQKGSDLIINSVSISAMSGRADRITETDTNEEKTLTADNKILAWALFNEALSLQEKFDEDGDINHLHQAKEIYEKTLYLNERFSGSLNNLANTIIDIANHYDDYTKLYEADEILKKATEISPDDDDILQSHGNLLLMISRKFGTQETLERAEKIIDHALSLNPSDTYNAACLSSLRGDEENCRKLLENSLNTGNILPLNELLADEDLTPMRNKDWFNDIVERLRQTESQ